MISVAFAETNGTINTSSYNATAPVTGLYGYTVRYCDNDAQCFGYKCFVDFDGEADDSDTSQPSGWCNQTAITDCYNDGKNYTKGFYFCVSNTTYRRCDAGGLGNWSDTVACTSGETCASGLNSPCSTSSSSTSAGAGGAGTNATTTKKASIEFTEKISDFGIIQGGSASKFVTVKNSGDLVLGDVALEVTGISFYLVAPSSIQKLNKTNAAAFRITFSPSSTTEVKSYSVQVKAVSNYTEASASFSFTLKVVPSNETIEKEILPTNENYLKLIDEYEKNITLLEKEGYNVSEARGILTTIKTKMENANKSIEEKDYFSAATQLSEVKTLFEEVNSSLAKATKPAAADYTLYIIIFVAVLIAAVVAYLFWPSKSAFPARTPRPPK